MESGGQTVHGGTGASDNLTLQSTSHATKGNIVLEELTALVIGGGTSATEVRLLEPSGGGSSYTGFVAPALAGNVVYTLPTADGSNTNVLTTNGSGTLSWAARAVLCSASEEGDTMTKQFWIGMWIGYCLGLITLGLLV